MHDITGPACIKEHGEPLVLSHTKKPSTMTLGLQLAVLLIWSSAAIGDQEDLPCGVVNLACPDDSQPDGSPMCLSPDQFCDDNPDCTTGTAYDEFFCKSTQIVHCTFKDLYTRITQYGSTV